MDSLLLPLPRSDSGSAAAAAPQGGGTRGPTEALAPGARGSTEALAQASQAVDRPPGTALTGRSSPGSGVDRSSALSPGSGIAPSQPGSPQSLWRNGHPGTPTGLEARVLKAYDPRAETLPAYTERIRKQAAALETLGHPLSPGVLDTFLGAAQEARNTAEKERMLRREYACELVEDDLAPERRVKISALEKMLRERGADPKVFKAKILRGESISPEKTRPETSAPATPVRPGSAGSRDHMEMENGLRRAEIQFAAAELDKSKSGDLGEAA